MADVQEAIRRLSIEATTEGVDEATDKLKKLGEAQDGVAVSSDKSEKASLSLSKQFEVLQRRFDETYRSQQDFAKVQNQVNAAVAQNPELQARGNQILDLAAQKYGQAGVAAKAFAAATSGVSGQLIAMSSGAGPVGVFLAAMGPWGLAAAAGIGAAEHAISALDSAAHNLAMRAVEMQKFADTVGLSVTQVQALESAAAKFGVTADQEQSAIGQFTARFDQLRKGQGEFFNELVKTNPALALQLSQAKDTASALTLFGTALQNVDNIFQRNALVKAATGKGGLSAVNFLSGLNVDEITASTVAAGNAIDDNLIKKLAVLEAESRQVTQEIKNNLTSIFAAELLTAELSFLENFKEMSQVARDFKLSPDLTSFLGLMSKLPSVLTALYPALGLLQKGAQALGPLLPTDPNKLLNNAIPPPSNIGVSFSKSFFDPGRTEADASLLRLQISAMGDAATFAQREQAALDALNFSEAKLSLTSGQLAAAQSAIKLSFASQELQARISALGDMATVDEVVRAKEMALNLERIKGVQLSDDEVAAIKRRTQAQTEAGKLNTQTQYGIFDPARQSANAQLTLQTLIDNGTIRNAQDYASALSVITKNLEDMRNRAAVAASAFPQLTQAMQQASDLRFQLDQAATSISADFGTAFTDIATGAKTASQAFKDLETAVIRSLANMVAQMLIVAPIAALLRNILGGIFPGVGSVLPGGLPFGQGGIGHAAEGGSFGAGDWSVVGERGPELVRFGKSSTVFPNSAMGNNRPLEIHITQAPDTKTSVSKHQGGSTDILEIVTEHTFGAIASGKGDKALATSHGAQPLLRSR